MQPRSLAGATAAFTALGLACSAAPAVREPPAAAPVAPGACAPTAISPSRTRMLTNTEYANAVQALLGVRTNDVSWLPERLTKDGFDGDVELIATSVSAMGSRRTRAPRARRPRRRSPGRPGSCRRGAAWRGTMRAGGGFWTVSCTSSRRGARHASRAPSR